jgi:glutamate dehydrogenase (NAD(P)+)
MAIQGFGNAGQNAARIGEELLGMKLVAASDSKGGVYNPKGIDAMHSSTTKSVPGASMDLPMPKPFPTRTCWSWRYRSFFPPPLKMSLPGKMHLKSAAKFYVNWPTAPRHPVPTISFMKKAFSFCRISWPTRAA